MNTEAPTNLKEISLEEKYLFDLQGYLLLPGVLDANQCDSLCTLLDQLGQTHPSSVVDKGLADGYQVVSYGYGTDYFRLNGLSNLDPVFDEFIDHPKVLPYLETFLDGPKFLFQWMISKEKDTGASSTVWHRAFGPEHYSFLEGKIRNRMINTIYFLTDNGPEDGCLKVVPGSHKSMVVPGSHKSNIDPAGHDGFSWLDQCAVPVTGRAGDVLVFTECLMHGGLEKTSARKRTNLYFAYGDQYLNPLRMVNIEKPYVTIKPEVYARFTPARKALTGWINPGLEHFATT